MGASARPIELIVHYDDSEVSVGILKTRKLVEDMAMYSTKAGSSFAAAKVAEAAAINGTAKAQQELNLLLEKEQKLKEEAERQSTNGTSPEATKKTSEAKAMRDYTIAAKAAEMEIAKGTADRWERDRAIESVNYKYRLERLAGNNAAIEQEERRHVSALANIDARRSASIMPVNSAVDVSVSATAASEAQKTAVAKHETLVRAKLAYEEAYADATGYNNQFDRFRAVEIAKTKLLKDQIKIRFADSEHLDELLASIDRRSRNRMNAIGTREAQFSDTPFQQHIETQKKLGFAIQNSSYQFADFAVQVAGGQSAMLAFSQQSTQLLQGLGVWGAVIGAGTAILGALYIGLHKSKGEVEDFDSALKSANFTVYFSQLETLSTAFREYAEAVQSGTGSDEASVLVLGYKAAAFEKAKQAVDRNTQSLIALYGSLENAQGAYRRLQSQTVSGLKIEAEISGLDSDNLGDAVQIQKLRNKAKLEEVQRGYDHERVAVQGWERQKNEDGKTYAETEEQYKKRQSVEILRINKDEQDSLNLARQIGGNEQLKIQRDFGKKSADEQKQRREKALAEQIAASQREMDAARKFYSDQAAAALAYSDRLLQAQSKTDMERLVAKQAVELREAETTKTAWVMTEEEFKQHGINMMLLREAQGQEIANQAKTDSDKAIKDVQDRNEKIRVENQKIAASYVTIAGVIAETWNVGPLQKALQWLQRIQTVLQAIEAIKTATTALSVVGAPVSPVAALFGGFFADGGRPPLGKASIVGENGPEWFVPDSAGTILNNRDATALARQSVAPTSRSDYSVSGSQQTSIHLGGDTIVIQGDLSDDRAEQIGRRVGAGKQSALREWASSQKSTPYFRAEGMN